MDSDQSAVVREGVITAPVATVLRGRRTVSAYRPELPPATLLDEAIELACWAPNHRLTEPWRFHRIGPQTKAAIIDLNTTLVAEKKGAEAAEQKRRQWDSVPGWLAVTCVRSTDALQAEEDYSACCCAVQNLMLAFWSAGVGTKWTTGEVTRHVQFFRLLNLVPERDRVVGLIWYGFPAAIPRSSRRPAAEITHHHP